MYRFLFFISFFCFTSAQATIPVAKIPFKVPGYFSYIGISPHSTSTDYLADGNYGRCNIYGATAEHLNFKAPAIHAYNPATFRHALVEMNTDFLKLIPQNIATLQTEVTRFFISIERLDTEALRFRPHRFTDRTTPKISEQPAYNKVVPIQAGVFHLDGTHIPFTDLPGQGLINTSISIHAGGAPADQILSGDNMHLPAVNGNPSRAYYSVVSHQDDKTRSAVTLHWLISATDENHMWRLLAQSPTFEDFAGHLASSFFKDTEAAKEIQKLTEVPVNFDDNQGKWRRDSTSSYEQTELGGYEIIFDAIPEMQPFIYTLPAQNQSQLRRVHFSASIENVNGFFILRQGNQTIPVQGQKLHTIIADTGPQNFDFTFVQEAGKEYIFQFSKDETARLGILHLTDLQQN